MLENTLAPNPLLTKEVATKIENYLNTEGYNLSNELAASDYVLSFAFAIDSGATRSYSGSFSSTSYRLNIYTKKFELVPQIQSYSGSVTSFTRYLVLVLFDTKQLLKSQESIPIWIAEVFSSGRSSDLRTVLDYLLVAAFQYYGLDTKGRQELTLPENDLRIQKLY